MKKRSKKRRKADPVSVQVNLRLRIKRGSKRPTKAEVNELWLHWVETGVLQGGLMIRGIFWRNPARHGRLSDWRYSEDSDRTVAPHPLESEPRGSHEDARATLKELLLAVRPAFS